MSEHIEVVTDPDTGGVEMVIVPDSPDDTYPADYAERNQE